MKRLLSAMAIAFSIAMAVVMGTRMSPDAMAVIVGIICGVVASIPTSVILVWVLRQRDRQAEAQMAQMRTGHFPPVVVVNGQGTNGYSNPLAPPALTAGTTPAGPRDFKVIGQENTETVGDILPPFWEQP